MVCLLTGGFWGDSSFLSIMGILFAGRNQFYSGIAALNLRVCNEITNLYKNIKKHKLYSLAKVLILISLTS